MGYTVRQTGLASILPAILLYCGNEDKLDDQGSDLGHDNLLIRGRNAAFASVVNYEAEHGIRLSDRQIKMSECEPRSSSVSLV